MENVGLCYCGCGQTTSIANRSRAHRGQIKGQHVKFIHAHQAKIPFHKRIVQFWEKTRMFPLSGWPDCIEWDRTVNFGGYGQSISILGETQAHRVAFVLSFGPIPEELELDHLCRNRRCVNPFHLEVVTRKINSRRGAKAKLTEAIVAEIRASKETQRALAVKYGVHHATIQAAQCGRAWS